MRICSRNTRRSGPAALGLISMPLSACQTPASLRNGPRLARSFGETVGSVKISAGMGNMGNPLDLCLLLTLPARTNWSTRGQCSKVERGIIEPDRLEGSQVRGSYDSLDRAFE